MQCRHNVENIHRCIETNSFTYHVPQDMCPCLRRRELIKRPTRYKTKHQESRKRSPLLCYTGHLTLKGEAGAKLVARLVELLGIERATNAKGQAAVDLGVVG